MDVQFIKERNSGKVFSVALGAGDSKIVVGGETSLPFLHFEGEAPNRPIIAMEVTDIAPPWPDALTSALGGETGVLGDPAAWARQCVEAHGADMVFLRFAGADPDAGAHISAHTSSSTPEQCAKAAQKVLEAAGVPMAVVGCGIDEIDNKVISAVAEACAGKNLLLGYAKQDNYNTAAAACMVHGHALIAMSPLDINICKQLNILVNEMGMPLDRIVIDPTIGGLGYGIEYAYSVQERVRIGALQGDRMLAMPVIGMVGQEAWKAKEAIASEGEHPGWGALEDRGVMWEALTATTLLQAGIDILVMRHPKAVALVKKHISELMAPSVLTRASPEA
jgi:acetyl-CoA decarbonylase/synthase complex subunit delta